MTDTEGGEWNPWHLNEKEGACPLIPDPIGQLTKEDSQVDTYVGRLT